MAKEADYNPPGYLITHFDKVVKLEPEQAQKFNDFRLRLCKELGQDNEMCNPTNLWRKALDLLLAHEPALLTKVDHFDAQGNKVES